MHQMVQQHQEKGSVKEEGFATPLHVSLEAPSINILTQYVSFLMVSGNFPDPIPESIDSCDHFNFFESVSSYYFRNIINSIFH